MLAELAGSAISGLTSLYNNAQNRESQEQANAANLAFQREYAQKNLDQQREFAQQGVRWKVADAQAAGLHPLAALGAQTSSFSPITVGSDTVKAYKSDLPDMGQNISRAISAGQTQPERASEQQQQVQKIAQAQELEKGSLENEKLRTEIATQRSQLGPPIPIPRPGPTRSVSGHAVSEDDIKQKPEDMPATNIVRPFGYPLRTNPFFSDGQQFEDRYGDSEIGSTIKFGVNTLADHIYTGYGLIPSDDTWRKPRRTRHNDAYISNSNRR